MNEPSRYESKMQVSKRIDGWVKTNRSEILHFLSKLVQTPSVVSPPEVHELACQRIVEMAYRDAGAEVDVFSPDEVEEIGDHPLFLDTWDGMPRPLSNRPNVVGRFPGCGGGRSLLLSTHVDTVPVGREPWRETGPFSGAVKEGKLFGRGSWDTKWGIAAGLYAVRCLQDLGAKLKGHVILESVVDEEFGGSHGTLASRLRGYNADFAINSEPTGMVVAPAHRGGGEWRITVRGDAGMAFGDRRLSNSVYKLASVVNAIREFDAERNRSPQPPRFFESDPRLPAYTMQVGGGGDSYADVSGIPHESYVIAWIEEYPGMDQDTHTANLTSFINAYLERDPEFDGVYPEYKPTIRYLPGSSVDPSHPFFDVLDGAFACADREYNLGAAPFAADTYVFNLYSPTPAITLGPRGGNAHAADEYVLVEDVLSLVRIYALTILGWCG